MHNDSKPKYFQQIKAESKISIQTDAISLFHISYDILRQNFGDLHDIGIKIGRYLNCVTHTKINICLSLSVCICVCVHV